MKRRIVQHGSSSLTVTLPVKWVDKFNLKKGEEINIEETGDTLLVSTDKSVAISKKVVSTSDYGIFTKNNLSHLYQLGYDDIEITYEDSKTFEEIRERIPGCIGYEIIDQKANKVFIKSIATTLESEFDVLLRKSFLITNEMAANIIELLESKQYAKLKETRNMESLNNKFTDVCIRILNKKGYKIPRRTMQMYEIVKNIERIADEFKYVCDLLKDNNKPLDKKFLEYFKETVDYYLAFYHMFYKFDSKLKKKLYLGRKELVDKYQKEMEKTKGKESVFLHHLVNIIQKTYEGAGGYFALVL
ncbi:phosphate uptake regulator PhoU [Candidatus Woesearchaeota archaeon]|nr:phosphate uptake regulator PhoU [Candidatus Woesearchaeota archaeon]